MPESVIRDDGRSLQQAIDSVRMGFQVIDFDWRYVYVNPAAALHGRRTVRDLVGRTMMEAYPGIEQTSMFAALSRCMHDRRRETLDNLFTFTDGQQRWFEVRVEPVDEGICVYSADIHERKLRELELEALERELRQADLTLAERLWAAVSRALGTS